MNESKRKRKMNNFLPVLNAPRQPCARDKDDCFHFRFNIPLFQFLLFFLFVCFVFGRKMEFHKFHIKIIQQFRQNEIKVKEPWKSVCVLCGYCAMIFIWGFYHATEIFQLRWARHVWWGLGSTEVVLYSYSSSIQYTQTSIQPNDLRWPCAFIKNFESSHNRLFRITCSQFNSNRNKKKFLAFGQIFSLSFFFVLVRLKNKQRYKLLLKCTETCNKNKLSSSVHIYRLIIV